ncbi:MAG TPA: sulfotransferase [Cryomorphaceae bacterium]|nr:sulfotransferase [Owenweeksia sp.]MBF98801.1 sulfotransferase [Owenweeksia sp.]HAD96301.1 sulfotransferase [Cryomorphaceae bacterium]HBF20033.1 sulfotransferase [Cryomorphaceae bacterium]
MIISHTHKFIFFAIPKTGTHAIRNALNKHLGKNDWEQVDLFRHSRIPIPEFEALEHGHITASEIKSHLGEEVWNTYFKFSVVRNPFDRFISYAFFKKGNTPLFQKHTQEILKLMFQNPNTKADLLFQPQLGFIADTEKNIMMDYVGRFENLQASYNAICERIGIAPEPLEKLNSSAHKDYRYYYDEDLVKLVGEYYQDDLSAFGYGYK